MMGATAGATEISLVVRRAEAIANQAAGAKAPLGNAAPYLYTLNGAAIYDVKAVTSPNNVSGFTDSPRVRRPTSWQTRSPLHWTARLASSAPSITVHLVPACVLTFGTDTSRKTSSGWDDVTGVDTPNGLPFVQEVVQ